MQTFCGASSTLRNGFPLFLGPVFLLASACGGSDGMKALSSRRQGGPDHRIG
jgi:hypothetical protein